MRLERHNWRAVVSFSKMVSALLNQNGFCLDSQQTNLSGVDSFLIEFDEKSDFRPEAERYVEL